MSRQVGLSVGVSMLMTIIDGADREVGFAQAWYAVALTMLVAALVALRRPGVTAAVPGRSALPQTASGRKAA